MTTDTTSKPFAVWITGVSAAGKSTLASLLQKELGGVIVDGDVIRNEANHIPAYVHPFGREGRRLNVHHGAVLAKKAICAGENVFISLISPYASDRSDGLHLLNEASGGRAILVYLECNMKVLEVRDYKQIYARAKVGSLKHVSGYDVKYQAPPDSACLRLDTAKLNPQQVADAVIDYLKKKELVA